MTAVTHRVTFVTPDGEETRVRVAEDEYLLDAGLAAGLDLPYRCRQGWCTTCASRLLEGSVDASEALRFYEEDEKAGFVLICSAYPRSDLVVETHRREAIREHRDRHGLPVSRG